jgi:hypothetical protein
MTVLPGVLGCRTLQRTVKVRLGTIPRYRGTVARWHAHLRGLATAIYEISGLALCGVRNEMKTACKQTAVGVRHCHYFPTISHNSAALMPP